MGFRIDVEPIVVFCLATGYSSYRFEHCNSDVPFKIKLIVHMCMADGDKFNVFEDLNELERANAQTWLSTADLQL